jgi:hypothetical protein
MIRKEEAEMIRAQWQRRDEANRRFLTFRERELKRTSTALFLLKDSIVSSIASDAFMTVLLTQTFRKLQKNIIFI